MKRVARFAAKVVVGGGLLYLTAIVLAEAPTWLDRHFPPERNRAWVAAHWWQIAIGVVILWLVRKVVIAIHRRGWRLGRRQTFSDCRGRLNSEIIAERLRAK